MEGRTGPLMDSWLFVCTPLCGERPLLLLLLKMSARLQFNGQIMSVHAWAHAFGAAGVWRSLLSVLVWLDTQLRPSFTVLASTSPDGGHRLLMVHLSGCLFLLLFPSTGQTLQSRDLHFPWQAILSGLNVECTSPCSLGVNLSPPQSFTKTRGTTEQGEEKRRRKDSFTS